VYQQQQQEQEQEQEQQQDAENPFLDPPFSRIIRELFSTLRKNKSRLENNAVSPDTWCLERPNKVNVILL
jgi:16S rRNA G966 N2-methylase RsmD